MSSKKKYDNNVVENEGVKIENKTVKTNENVEVKDEDLENVIAEEVKSDKSQEKERKEKKGMDNFFNTSTDPFKGIWGWFIACFILSFFINWFFLGGAFSLKANDTLLSKDFVESLKNSSYVTVQDETVFRCVSYTPVFTEMGVKQYDVRFRDIHSDLAFNVIVPAQEIDTYTNVEKDAKYEGTVTYLYVENAFKEITKDLEEDKVQSRIVALLKGQSEYAEFGVVSDISFMYSHHLEEFSMDKATTILDGYVDELLNPTEEVNNSFPILSESVK